MRTLARRAPERAHELAERHAATADTWSVTLLHLRVAAHSSQLDTALALGANPRTRPDLTLRAGQLQRRGHRRAIAATLRRMVAEAGASRPPVRATAVTISRRQIRAHADELLALADRLDSPGPANAGGIAVARRLITDAVASPLYVDRDPGTLTRRIQWAMAQMDRGLDRRVTAAPSPAPPPGVRAAEPA